MVWLEGAGALEVLEGLMGAGRGRILGQVQRVSSDKWCMLRGTHGCRTWKNIRAGAKSFFGQVVYATGDGHCIRFWHDPWSGHIPL